MAKSATINNIKNAAIKSAKLTGASAGGLALTNFVTEKVVGMDIIQNQKIAKLLVSGVAALGLPFFLSRYGKMGNLWTDGIASGGGLRFSAELLKFLNLKEYADKLNPLAGPSDSDVVEIEVDSMEQLRRIEEAAALSGPTPALPMDANLMPVNGARRTETMRIT